MMYSVRLKDLLVSPVKNGYSPICVDDPTGKWVLGLGALDGNGIDKTEIKPVPADNKKTDPYLLKKGDFLVSRSNTLDKVGRAALYRGGLENCSYPDLMMRFRIHKEKVFPDFLEEYLQSNIARRYFMRCAAGTSGSMVKITKSVIEKLVVNLPSLAEQKSIAEIAASNNAVIKKTEALIDAKERQFGWLRANIIKNVQNTNTQKFGDFLKESRIPDTIDNPQKRLTVRLHLKGVDVREYRGTEKEGATQYFIRKSGQLIYGKQNIFRGSIGIIPNALDGYSSSQDIPAFDIAESVNADWLYWYMSRPHFYERLEHFAAGSGSKRLHPKELFKMNIDVPPIEKQKEVVAFLDTAQQEITLLKKLADQYRTQKRGLMQKLLAGKCEVKL